MSPRFSIVVPIYNQAEYLEEALRSIQGQTFSDYECLLIDDASTDGSKAIEENYVDSDGRFSLLEQANQGQAAARNTGFAAAKGDYVLFLDGDDVFEPNLLEGLAEYISGGQQDIVIYNADILSDLTKANSGYPLFALKDNLPSVFTASDISEVIFNSFGNSVWNKTFRRQFLVENRIYFNSELRRLEDVPFTNKALVLAKSISSIDKIFLHYRIDKPFQGASTSNSYRYYADNIRALEEFYSFLVGKQFLSLFCKSFDNNILDALSYSLYNSLPFPEGESTFNLAKAFLQGMDLSDAPAGHFYESRLYDLKEVIVHQAYSSYLKFAYREERAAKQIYYKENMRILNEWRYLNVEWGKLKSENQRILGEWGKLASENQRILGEWGKLASENQRILGEWGKLNSAYGGKEEQYNTLKKEYDRIKLTSLFYLVRTLYRLVKSKIIGNKKTT